MEVKTLKDSTSYWFESWDEALNAPFLHEGNRMRWNRDHGFGENDSYGSWHGCTMQELIDNFNTGWQDGLKKLESMLDELGTVEVVPSSALIRKRHRVRDAQGDNVDIHRVWSGHLDTAWDRMKRQNVYSPSHRFVSIFVNCNTPGGVPHKATLWRAAAVARLVEALQGSGRMVRVCAGQTGGGVYHGQGWDRLSTHAVLLKDFHTPLVRGSMALACTAMFYRRAIFRMMACSNVESINSTYGNCPPESQIRNVFPHKLREDELERGAMLVRVDNCFTKEAAVKVCEDVKRQLTEESADKRYAESGTEDGGRYKYINRTLFGETQ